MDAFWADLEAKFFKKTLESGNGKGCIEWTGAKKGRTGYGLQIVQWPDLGEKREPAHRVAMCIATRQTRKELPDCDINNNKLECSHICHTKLCVNFQHIVREAHTVNLERIHCKNQGLCTRNHTPHCIICNLYQFIIYKLFSH